MTLLNIPAKGIDLTRPLGVRVDVITSRSRPFTVIMFCCIPGFTAY